MTEFTNIYPIILPFCLPLRFFSSTYIASLSFVANRDGLYIFYNSARDRILCWYMLKEASRGSYEIEIFKKILLCTRSHSPLSWERDTAVLEAGAFAAFPECRYPRISYTRAIRTRWSICRTTGFHAGEFHNTR
ncbi:hypothetical protein D3C80_1048430 [compost metagenome]